MNIMNTNQETYNIDNALIKECKRQIKKYQKQINKLTGVRKNCKKKQTSFKTNQPDQLPNLECESNEAAIMTNIASAVLHPQTRNEEVWK